MLHNLGHESIASEFNRMASIYCMYGAFGVLRR